MGVHVDFDASTAVKVAEYFECSGMTIAAIKMWQGICWASPYDQSARRKLANLLFHLHRSAHAFGTVERSHSILNLISQSYPTPELASVYFENLKLLLKSRPKRGTPGDIVLGVGAGRCGSTTLAAAMAAIPGVCATHENPPPIDWQPTEEQARFHLDRLRFLADYHQIVFDASHWWLNLLGRYLAEIPGGKVIAMCRNTEDCVRSFMRIKGAGLNSINHWAPPGNNIWATALFDPTYPSYTLEANLLTDPDAAKAAKIRRYVSEYNQQLRRLAELHPDRVMLVRTEELNHPAVAERLSQFLGARLIMPAVSLNVGNTADSDNALFRF